MTTSLPLHWLDYGDVMRLIIMTLVTRWLLDAGVVLALVMLFVMLYLDRRSASRRYGRVIEYHEKGFSNPGNSS